MKEEPILTSLLIGTICYFATSHPGKCILSVIFILSQQDSFQTTCRKPFTHHLVWLPSGFLELWHPY